MTTLRTAFPPLLITFLATACAAAGASGPTGEFRPDGTTSPTPAPLRYAPPNNAVLAQYRHFHEVFERALETNDEREIADVATGRLAARLTRVVHRQRQIGVVRRSHAVLNPRIAELDARRALVVDCVLTHGLWTYRIRTGARVGPRPKPQRVRLHTVLVLVDQIWKVSETSTPKARKC